MMGPEIGSPPSPPLTLSLPHRPTAGDPTILDPPSYADAIFRPENPLTAGNPTTSHYLEITVTDPQKHPDHSHTTYLITTLLRGRPSPFIVRRRFRHVVALADRLSESYRGYFIPIRPDKSVVGGPEFVEERRNGLERYLRRLAAHPVLGRGDEIGVFLKAEEFEDGVAAARGGRDLVRVLKELGRSVANDWGGTKGLVEEDREFLEKRERIQEFGLQLNSTSEQVFGGLEVDYDLLELCWYKFGK